MPPETRRQRRNGARRSPQIRWRSLARVLPAEKDLSALRCTSDGLVLGLCRTQTRNYGRCLSLMGSAYPDYMRHIVDLAFAQYAILPSEGSPVNNLRHSLLRTKQMQLTQSHPRPTRIYSRWLSAFHYAGWQSERR
jgi:hypothetical protein